MPFSSLLVRPDETRAELDLEIELDWGDAGDVDKTAGNTEEKVSKLYPLPPHLPRRDIIHDPADTTCRCGQQMQHSGQDVTEKLE